MYTKEYLIKAIESLYDDMEEIGPLPKDTGTMPLVVQKMLVQLRAQLYWYHHRFEDDTRERIHTCIVQAVEILQADYCNEQFMDEPIELREGVELPSVGAILDEVTKPQRVRHLSLAHVVGGRAT